ncbi:aa3-type cytochrome c oxidase subunit IV [Zavarzinia sp. CC-PAN008]
MAMDIRAQQHTYNAFMGLTKWGTIGLLVLLALMAYFLV